jgi:hypothetical protein
LMAIRAELSPSPPALSVKRTVFWLAIWGFESRESVAATTSASTETCGR